MTKVSRFVAITLPAFLFAAAAIAADTHSNFNDDLIPPDPHYMLYQDWLEHEVRHQLVLLPFYSVFDNLEYKINGSEVTLLGQVTQPTVKLDAENAVKGIEGVTKVINNIEVLPVSPMDDQIRRAEFRAIYSEPALQRYAFGPVPPIHIIVKRGHVTLEGVVNNQGDKNLVSIRANSVPGVFSVTNNLRVQSGE
jgi:hyperosmotically inducible periplasmic protein